MPVGAERVPGFHPSIPIGGMSRSPSDPSTGERGARTGAPSAHTTRRLTMARGIEGGQRRSRRGASTAPVEARGGHAHDA
jgi:hypothetical protein